MNAAVLAALVVVAITHLILGWSLGYQALSAYAAYWALCGLLISSSVMVTRRWLRFSDPIAVILCSSMIGFAIVVCAGFLLGVLGFISTGGYLAVLGGCFAASAVGGRRAEPMASWRMPTVAMAVIVPMLAFAVAVAVVKSPFTLYDSLSYHLFFPARWLQEHRLSIIPTPFSDEAQAYAPANGELFFLFLMTPFHGDIAARLGQLPFLLVAAVALYGLARRAGAAPLHAMYAPMLLVITKRVVEQAVGADVDLICWAAFLTALYFGLRALDTDSRRDWSVFGMSLGLCLGTKYVALVFSPVLILPLVVKGLRRRAVWVLPGIFALAAPWYLRNWIVGGSPVYPASLGFAGIVLGQGAYSRHAMSNSILHSTTFGFLPVMVSLAFGASLFFATLPFWMAGTVKLVVTRQRWPALFLAVAPVALSLLFWFGVPDNLDCRFLLPATMLAWIPVVCTFGNSRKVNAAIHVLLAGAIAWTLAGWRGELPVEPLAWPIGNWLTFSDVVASPYTPAFIAVAVAAAVVTWLVRDPRALGVTLAVLVCAPAVALALRSRVWCPPDGCEFLEISSTYIRLPSLLAWQWTNDHVSNSTIAYAGNNLPYPLTGKQLANRVYYVNIDRHSDWRFHDYDHAHRRKRPGASQADELAVSSGLLRHASIAADGSIDAVRPRYERMQGDREAWIKNLRAGGVGHLFVSVLSVYEADYMWHDAAGFPIEAKWAEADPQTFPIVYENSEIKIFAVNLSNGGVKQ